jgi:hypothetical protein
LVSLGKNVFGSGEFGILKSGGGGGDGGGGFKE